MTPQRKYLIYHGYIHELPVDEDLIEDEEIEELIPQ
jgi:hypothetical protein